jgi:hypothetical protein
VTEAAGGKRTGPGGEITAFSEGDAQVASGALVDVSGGVKGGDAGSAELSAKDHLALGGTLRAGAATGSKRGKITIDPTVLTIPSGVNLQGAGAIVAEASQRIDVSSNAIVNLADGTQAGDGSADRQSLTLRSGGDINFGNGAEIVDDGSGAGGQKIWDVNLVAGADLSSANLLALAPGTLGSIYLSGANYNPSGAFVSLGTNNGLVSLTHGDLTVRATADLEVGDGGGLEDVTGKIDVQVGRDVKFRAGSQTNDGVIQNGSGDISIAAGGSVLLGEGPLVQGNAAIRTVGVMGTDGQGNTTISDGGSITIQAGGDVDAGIGDRWLEPGPSFNKQSLLTAIGDPTQFGLPADYVPPDYDPMPVVQQGILGIGTQAGGNVTIVAGGSVRTGVSNQNRSGATAAGLGTQYDGSHIGVFGVPVTQVMDPIFSVERNVPIAGAPQGQLTVVAGDEIEGNFIARNGLATLRAGYSLASGVAPQALDPAHIDSQLVDAAGAQGDPTQGWFGTLARPVTVDLIDASVDGGGRNGVAIRAIENPSLVYPPAVNGTSAVPTWDGSDYADLRSSNGDVLLVGNDISMPTQASQTAQPNSLVRVLPPNVSIETDHGDLVLLNDFTIYPSTNGGLTLQIAGQVRTANFSGSNPAILDLSMLTFGATGNVAFTLPAGTKLRDPVSGIEFTLKSQVQVNARAPAVQAKGTVVFTVDPAYAGKQVVVPAGTRVVTPAGQVYQVTQTAILPPPAQRLSQGTVTVFRAPGDESTALGVPDGSRLIGPGGAVFLTSGQATLLPGQDTASVSVVAVTPGVDVPAFGLALASPIQGIGRATNLTPTVRPTAITASVLAVDPGRDGNTLTRFQVTSLMSPVPGIESVSSPGQISGGADIAVNGVGVAPGNTTSGNSPLATSQTLGPAGDLPAGTRLVLEDPSVLPAGVNPSDLLITVNQLDPTTLNLVQPAIYKTLTPGRNGQLRPDPDPGMVATPPPNSIWVGASTSASIVQSDAYPSIDQRDLSGSFDYAAYLANCRSGLACDSFSVLPNPPPNDTLGTGPTHANDPTRSDLRALGGFDRVQIQLAKPAFVLTGDPGPDGIFGTPDDGNAGSLVDFALLTQNNKASDETLVWVPIGDADFGSVSQAPGVPPNPYSGIRVAGPGTAKLLVGVLPNAPQVDLNGNGVIDPDESTGDRDGQPGVSASEWLGPPAAFTALDDSQRVFNLGAGLELGSGPIFSSRLVIEGGGDGVLTPAEAPYVPSGRGGNIVLASAPAGVPAAQLPPTLGISTIGNVFTPTGQQPVLPTKSADLWVVAGGDIDLNTRGSIETDQGGRLVVESVAGGITAGNPPPGYMGDRGIVTLFRPPGFGQQAVSTTGGGSIGIDTDSDFSVGGLALVSLSGGNIDVYSRSGSIDAGVGSEFQNPSVSVTAEGVVQVSYLGSGIAALGGNVNLHAHEDVRIGAGITGAGITIDAGQSIQAGSGSVNASGNVNLSAGQSIQGTFSSSTGSINVSGGTVGQGANLSAAGIVAGAGAGVGSNTGGGKVSAELNNLSDRAAETASGGFQTASALATGASHGVVIQVTSHVIGDSGDDDDSKKHK